MTITKLAIRGVKGRLARGCIRHPPSEGRGTGPTSASVRGGRFGGMLEREGERSWDSAAMPHLPDFPSYRISQAPNRALPGDTLTRLIQGIRAQ